MRAIVLWVLLFSADPSARAQASGSVTGVVLDDVTGDPVSKAVVLLDGGYPPPRLPYGVVTDRDGKFSVPAVTPGTYTVKIQRAGYLSSPWGLPLNVAAGETLAPVTLKITKQGIIAGRITPPGQNRVELWKVPAIPHETSALPSNPVLSEADGTFVIGDLRTGRYFLETPSRSLALDVIAGKEIRGVELKPWSGPTFRIAGLARNPVPGKRMPNGFVSLVSKDPSGRLDFRRSARINPQTGAFAFASVPPGDYRIASEISVPGASEPRNYYARQAVHVERESVNGISLVFTPMAVVTGTVTEEPNLPPRSQPLVVRFESDNAENIAEGSAQVLPKAAFRLQVTPGRYWVMAGNWSENVRSVKAIRFNGQAIAPESQIDITAEGGDLKVTFGAPGREIAGTVRDASGRTVAGAKVAAWVDGGFAWTAESDATGHFTIRNTPRGQVYVAACEFNDVNPWDLPSFRIAFQGRAAKVPEKAPMHVSLDLKAIPRTVAEAEVFELP
jgi:hypothetical protein